VGLEVLKENSGSRSGGEAEAARRAEESALKWPADLVVCPSFTIRNVLPVVNRHAPFRVFLGTPRHASARVRRAPCIRHVVET
jgi:hypothetical protein